VAGADKPLPGLKLKLGAASSASPAGSQHGWGAAAAGPADAHTSNHSAHYGAGRLPRS
jgi:hypothetical protein